MSGAKIATAIPINNVLLPPKMKRGIIWSYKYGELFMGHPYSWSDNVEKVGMARGWKLIAWKLHMAAAGLYTLFIWCRAIQVGLDERYSYTQKIYMKCIAAYMTLGLTQHWCILTHGELLAKFSQCLIAFVKKIEGTYVRQGVKPPKMQFFMAILMEQFFFYCNAISTLMMVNAFFRPNSPEQITSIIGLESRLSLRLGAALSMGYIEYVYHSSSLALSMISFAASSVILTMIFELSTRTCKVTSTALQRSEAGLHFYQVLRILTQLKNEIYGTLFFSIKMYGIVVIVFCWYGSIKLHGSQALALGVLGNTLALIVLVLFRVLAAYYSRSSEVLSEFGRMIATKGRGQSSNCRYLRKVLKSLPTIKIILRGYFVDPPMVLTLTDIIVSNIASFLLVNA